MRVALIPTGQLELLALGPALERLFPGHEFCAVAERPHEGMPFDGFTTSRLPIANPPECFETADPAYAADDGSACTALIARNRRTRRNHGRPAWLVDGREHHPKAYLSWLCREPRERQKCTTYRETGGGAQALAALDWAALLAEDDHFGYARALVHDIADALGESLPGEPRNRAVALTGGYDAAGERVLRNL